MLAPGVLPCRFDADGHIYTDLDGNRLPSITQLLKAAGEIDDRWFTEESSERGTRVHRLTAQYDLAPFDVEALDDAYKGHLANYIEVVRLAQFEIVEVEQHHGHAGFRFAGTLDRVVRRRGRLGIPEIKAGAKAKAHQIQTALQAIVVAPAYRVPPESFARWAVYLSERKGRIEPHEDPRDFDRAREILREYREAI